MRPPEPVYAAERVAAAIVALARTPRREVVVGGAGQLALLGHAVFPAVADRLTATLIEKRQFAPQAVPPSHGNLFVPAPEDEAVSGGFAPLLWDRLERPLFFATLLALPVILYGVLRKRARQRASRSVAPS